MLNLLVVRVILDAAQPREGQPGTLPVGAGGQPPGRLGQEEGAEAEGDGEADADADDGAPAGVALVDVPDAVVDEVGDEDAEGDHELVRGDDGAADLAGRALALEHGNTDGQVTDAQTGCEAAHHHVDPALHGGDLDNVADNEDDDTEGKTLSPTEPIRSAVNHIVSKEYSDRVFLKEGLSVQRSSERTKESTDTHERDDQRLDSRVERIGAIGLKRTETVLEVMEQQHARDLTGIIAEQETAERGDDAHHDGLQTAVRAIDAYRSARQLLAWHRHMEEGQGKQLTFSRSF